MSRLPVTSADKPPLPFAARASKLGIEGRSKMSKRELVAAIERAEP